VKFPTIGNPVIDELIDKLRVTARGSTDEAIDRAADVIRHGNRTNLVVVLTGTAFLAWLLTHNSRQ
jgi:DNA-binding MurR/RpiR family transcriptional regulator